MSSIQLQRTLAGSATLQGQALHTGHQVKLTLHPAPVGHGYKFLRKDLPDEPLVEAKADRVKTVERATTLVEGNAKIHTVEHVLSALAGMQVDNALIEMDANEPPIGDGSALPYVELIKEAGIVEQESPRLPFESNEPIHIEAGGSIMTLFPGSEWQISATQVGPQESEGRFTQYLSLKITPEIYEKEIAPARTFVFYEDVKPLMDKGLIKGGSLENALVIQGESILSKEPLRFENELVRHKILDIIGDLALVGHPIRGHIVAVRPGHGPNTTLAKAVMKRHTELLAMAPKPMTSSVSVLDVNGIMELLPHRYPFLMVDRIVELDGDKKAVGVKSISINEPYFQGHFPGHPVMPGVLQLEAMAQVASIIMMHNSENAGKIGYFMSADDVKFRKPVLPGDTLFIHAELTRARRNMARATCQCMVNGDVVSEGVLLFGLVTAS